MHILSRPGLNSLLWGAVFGIGGLFLLSTPAHAAGEIYTLDSPGVTLTVDKGSVDTIVHDTYKPLKLTLESDDYTQDGTKQLHSYKGSFAFKNSSPISCNSISTSPYLRVIIQPSSKKVISSEISCHPDVLTGNVHTAIWGQSTYTQSSSTPSTGGGTNSPLPSVSGNETFSFIDQEEVGIRACGGIFNQFTDKCLTFTYSITEDHGVMLVGGVDGITKVYNATGSMPSYDCRAMFVLGVTNSVQNNNKSGFLNYIPTKTIGDDCTSRLTAEQLKNLDGSKTTNKTVSIELYTANDAARDLCQNAPYNYKLSPASSVDPIGNYTLTACVNGFENASNPGYCSTAYPAITIQYQGSTIENSREKEREACRNGQGGVYDKLKDQFCLAGSTASGCAPEVTEADRNCGTEVTGIGWIICPIINAVTGMTGALWLLIDGVLNLNPIESGGAVENVWREFMRYGNVILVIIGDRTSNIGPFDTHAHKCVEPPACQG